MARILYMSPALAKDAIFASHKALIEAGTGLIRVVPAPNTSTSLGKIGQIAVSGQYFYAATGENKWGRALVSKLLIPLYCNSSEIYCNNSSIYCNQIDYLP